jgi:hypothetical protein
MSNKYNLVYDGHPVMALPPAADSAGRSGQWISLTNAHKVYVVVDIAQGAGTGVPISFQQATSVAGAGAKALSGNLNIWANQNTAASDTNSPQTAAETFTTSTATGNKKIIFEVVPGSVLDVTNGFKYIQVNTGASGSGNVTAAGYFILPGRFEQNPPPSAIV